MPLNSYECEQCGKRNNYVVELDTQGKQMVTCTVCGHNNEIDYDKLPQRVKDTLSALASDAQIFEDSDTVDALNPVDTVDDTLAQVDKRFQAVKEEMSSFNDVIGIEGNISRIAEEYISNDVLDSITSISSSVFDESGNMRSDWKQQGFSSLVDNMSMRMENDSVSAHVVSYIQQVVQSGRGMEAIADVDLMKAAGLNKKERFLIKQAVKNNQITGILQQVLGGESF